MASRSPGASEDQLKRKLHLPGRALSLIDDAKATAADDVHRQAEVHEVKEIEDFNAELHCQGFGISPPAECRIFHDGEVEIVEPRTSKGAAPKGSDSPLIGAGPAGKPNRDAEESGVGISLP